MGLDLIGWAIGNGSAGIPERLRPATPELEHRLEDWITADVSLVEEGLLLIGRQLPTSFGGTLDLLAIDPAGDLVVLELKRDRTPREMVAQALEYTAWVSQLDYEAVMELGAGWYGDEQQFQAAFEQRFGAQLPNALNESQRIVLVAPHVSSTVAAVVEYLSGRFSVPINAVTFRLFSVGQQHVLVRTALIEEETAPAASSKRRKQRTLEQLLALADENGTRPIIDVLLALRNQFPSVQTSYTSIALRARAADGRYLAALSMYPAPEADEGVLVNLPVDQLRALLGLNEHEADELVDGLVRRGVPPVKPLSWPGWRQTVVKNSEQARALVATLLAVANGSSTARRPDGKSPSTAH